MLVKIAGLLIFLSFIATNYIYFSKYSSLLIPGVLSWIAFIVLFSSLAKKKLLLVLLILSLANFIFLFINGIKIDFTRVLSVNQYLLTLLIGVSFLRLITIPKIDKINKKQEGKRSFLNTYLGVHLFGSVINLSSLVIVADKLYNKSHLSKLQILVLTRAFSSDAFWSPFFVAFAAALTYVPNFDKSTIIVNGVCLAFIAFCITYLDTKKAYDMDKFLGYPLNLETLYIPVLLALMVLISHYYDEKLKIIILLSSFSFFLTFIILSIKQNMIKSTFLIKDFILFELPKMKMELSLFLVAGMFGISISSILTAFGVSLPFDDFRWIEASFLLLVFILLSFVGIHPIITIAIIGDIINQYNHTLIAATFLIAWSITVSTSPFSGLNLTMQSRYNIKAKEIFVLNLPYSIKMYFISVLVLFILDKFIIY